MKTAGLELGDSVYPGSAAVATRSSKNLFAAERFEGIAMQMKRAKCSRNYKIEEREPRFHGSHG
jgi:hypothetical protein